MKVSLLVLEGAHQGQKIKLPPTQFVIGRDQECHLRPATPDVSRFHCAIARLAQQVLVCDLKSRNGTFVNGKRLEGTEKVKDGDVLQVGPLKFQIQIDVGPGSLSPHETNMSWLLRGPDQEEAEALDPSRQTEFICNILDEENGDMPRPAATEAGHPHRAGSALAGDFLRDYLNRRKRATEGGKPPDRPSSESQ